MQFRIILFTLSLLSSQLAQAQTQRYSGYFQSGSLEGKAEFEYRVQRKDTLREGFFRMSGPLRENNGPQSFPYFRAAGSFKDHQPDGNWLIQVGQYQTRGGGAVEDGFLRVPLDGWESRLSGDIERGIAHGKWQFLHYLRDSTRVADTLWQAELGFDAQGQGREFSVRTLSGHVVKMGEGDDGPAGSLVFLPKDSRQASEIWWFEDGLLRGVLLPGGESRDSLLLPLPETGFDTASLHWADQLLPLVEGLYILWNHKPESTPGMKPTLEEFLRILQPVDSVLQEVNGVKLSWQPPVRAMVQPEGSTGREYLSELTAVQQSVRAQADTLMGDAQLQILSRNDKEVARQLEAVSYMRHELWQVAHNLLWWRDHKVLRLMPRSLVNQYIEEWVSSEDYRHWLESEGLATIIDSEPVRALQKDVVINDLEAYTNLARHWKEVLSVLKDNLEKKLKDKRKERTLLAFEDSLMVQFRATERLLDSLVENAPDELNLSWEKIREGVEKPLDEYSALEDFDARKKALGELHTCFAEMRQLLHSLGRSTGRQQQIAAAYTRKVWNPYTYTHMEEKVKKRLFNTYREELVPDWYHQVSENFNCQDVGRLMNTWEKLHRRMLQLRDEDTQDLERNLRKTRQVRNKWKLLNLENAVP